MERLRTPTTAVAVADGERGSGTVTALGLLGCVGLICAIAVGLGAAGTARVSAQSAADLGALAGAQRILDGGFAGDACPLAAQVVARNGATLASCAADAATEQVRVTTSRRIRLPFVSLSAKATALAGPEPDSPQRGSG